MKQQKIFHIICQIIILKQTLKYKIYLKSIINDDEEQDGKHLMMKKKYCRTLKEHLILEF